MKLEYRTPEELYIENSIDEEKYWRNQQDKLSSNVGLVSKEVHDLVKDGKK